MKFTRRSFIQKTSFATVASGIMMPKPTFSQHEENSPKTNSVNPWIELSKKAYLHNAETISKMANGNPVLAVLKNNAYGLGDTEVGRILDESPKIAGIALVKEVRALAIRKAGVKKSILLMADFDEKLGKDLVKADITLSVHSYQSLEKIQALTKKVRSKIKVELYIDTGLGRMGMPYHLALPWAKKIAAESKIHIEGAFTTLTTPRDFAQEQLKRFNQLVNGLKQEGIQIARKHAAPSYSLLDIPDSHLDVVRPGILLHGSFPIIDSPATKMYTLQPTFRLKARVIRVEKLRKGDSVGFSRFYTAEKDEWIATIPIGWADGYDSGSENGAKVLLNNKLYRVINVNASHCNLLLGEKIEAKVGDIATLIGPDHPEITPEGFARSIKGHNYLQIQYKESIPKYVKDHFE